MKRCLWGNFIRKPNWKRQQLIMTLRSFHQFSNSVFLQMMSVSASMSLNSPRASTTLTQPTCDLVELLSTHSGPLDGLGGPWEVFTLGLGFLVLMLAYANDSPRLNYSTNSSTWSCSELSMTVPNVWDHFELFRSLGWGLISLKQQIIVFCSHISPWNQENFPPEFFPDVCGDPRWS